MASFIEPEGFSASSFPKNFGYSLETERESEEVILGKPKILLVGLCRSGKSSIQKVVFQKMSPNETLFLESTNKIVKDDVCNSAFVNFQLWDMPGALDIFDPNFDSNFLYSMHGSMIFVMDSQVKDDYLEALNKLHLTFTKVYKMNPKIRFEVFIHKADGLTEDNKMETQRDIVQRATDDLSDSGYDQINISFHLTSIYDHSVFEAFSKVVQRLIPQLSLMENLINLLVQNSAIEKAFLFDIVSKMYIVTDSAPVDMQTYELCCDTIDVIIDISCIYGLSDDGITSFDDKSAGLIKLNNGTILYFREVSHLLALVCILREDNFERQGIIDYNVLCFRGAIQKLLIISEKLKENGDKDKTTTTLANGKV